MAVTQARPDFAAHTRAVRASLPDWCRSFDRCSGRAGRVPRLGQGDPRGAPVGGWRARARRKCATGCGWRSGRAPLAEAESPEIAQAWFQGLNPQLDDRSPARMLREGGSTKSARRSSRRHARS